MLHKVLSEKIPIWQDEIRSVNQEKGNQKVGDVIVSQLYGGMRGIKGLTCETSAVSADKGLIIRGYPLLDITHISPEEVFYLLLTGDLPNDDQLSDLQAQLRSHQNIPDYIWKILEAMPKDSHPMTMLTVAIQSMQVDSLFASKYDEGIPKSDYWKWTLEDGIRLVAKVTGIAAGIYR
ncbi:MAG: citrate/2-methylcitrate synthase, partial [Candidatus Marinimicrobia bacterium]|nr:citrate/2-methylcitrate synthase [Candidatus Neomarinimicrobiota bacterium]